MRLIIKGKGDVILNPKDDFIWSGGEGDIYSKGDVVYKIYNDPQKMIPEDAPRHQVLSSLSLIIKHRDQSLSVIS
jgi:hypothetical protein